MRKRHEKVIHKRIHKRVTDKHLEKNPTLPVTKMPIKATIRFSFIPSIRFPKD